MGSLRFVLGFGIWFVCWLLVWFRWFFLVVFGCFVGSFLLVGRSFLLVLLVLLRFLLAFFGLFFGSSLRFLPLGGCLCPFLFLCKGGIFFASFLE